MIDPPVVPTPGRIQAGHNRRTAVVQQARGEFALSLLHYDYWSKAGEARIMAAGLLPLTGSQESVGCGLVRMPEYASHLTVFVESAGPVGLPRALRASAGRAGARFHVGRVFQGALL